MCETPKGDSFTFYAKTGASANAFTSYDRTCYLFSATQKIDENLDILLGMVGKPWFTKATIAKEQGIIGQEIKMYDDSPDWRLLNALFRCLYADHPLRDDIAGTVESIAEITPAMLYDSCKAFYAPGTDHIQMPPLPAFRDAESFVATLSHEAVHWTAAAHRVNRDLSRYAKDRSERAREELIAELGSCFLCADLGIVPELEPRPDHAAYLQSWLKVLGDDRRAIFAAAAHAQRAVAYLHGLQGEATEELWAA